MEEPLRASIDLKVYPSKFVLRFAPVTVITKKKVTTYNKYNKKISLLQVDATDTDKLYEKLKKTYQRILKYREQYAKYMEEQNKLIKHE